jgi:hypothetical protein
MTLCSVVGLLLIRAMMLGSGIRNLALDGSIQTNLRIEGSQENSPRNNKSA